MAELATYRAKRDFRKTPEPSGGDLGSTGGDGFVVQKHAARRLHYDLRLELDGVLKSWAVTRGPSLVAGDKRLAVEVEDHPLDYAGFEGRIPAGQYGGGTVIVWDRGRWIPVTDPHRGLAKGHLEFRLEGEKLSGRWHLVRIRGRRGEKRTNWLLIKSDDEAARESGDPEIVDEAPKSVLSGRTIEAMAQAGDAAVWRAGGAHAPDTGVAERPSPPEKRVRRRKAAAGDEAAAAKSAAGPTPLPAFVEPALATLQAQAPVGEDWIHEIKFDGYRLQARIAGAAGGEGGRVSLLTRTGLDWTDRFGTAVTAALAALPVETALVDGELVVEGPGGASDFSALQADLAEGRADRFVYYAFDLLHLDGRDLTAEPLSERKRRLEALLSGAGEALRFSAHFDEAGDMLLRHACRLSLEGIVSKRVDRPYRPGRGRDWIKTKCADRQEFVVAGWVPSTVSDDAVGSLVLGYHKDGVLRHAGRVGTGFSAALARDLVRRLKPLAMRSSPFAEKLDATQRRGAKWVEPVLVAEVEFRGWTADRHLRHASFRGLREDKAAEEIVRETPKDATSDGGAEPARAAAGRRTRAKPTGVAAPRSAVRLTHPDRVYWPEAGVTKEGLLAYYGEVWRLIAPHVVARPLSLLRCPDGIVQTCFFQKHAWRGIQPAIRRMRDPEDAEGDEILFIEDFDGLAALVQSGVLEIHPWGAPIADTERPDRLIFDLDPGEDVTWTEVVEAAVEVRARLQADGLPAFLKTSGGKGLHVVVPLAPRAGWDDAKAYARGLADAMAADAPERYVAVATKAKRPGRIFVDYLRNGRGATAVAPYSTRARPGAAVSTPVDWDEMGPGLRPDHFGVANLGQRLAALSRDPWADFFDAAVPLETKARKRGRRG